MRSRTSDLRIPSSDALPLSHRDSGEQVSWLLGSAMSIASCFVHRTRKMVSFKLGKEIEKDVFRLVTSVEQRKISSSISLPSLKLIIFLVLFTKYDGNCCQSVWNGSLSLMLFNCKYHFQSTFSNLRNQLRVHSFFGVFFYKSKNERILRSMSYYSLLHFISVPKHTVWNNIYSWATLNQSVIWKINA